MANFATTRRAILGVGAASAAISATPAWAKTKTKRYDADVLILGAGISGLHAARMLEQSGLSVQVIEGSGRIGGRCWTARDVPGRPELGAQQIGFGYGRVRGNASDLGIELVDPPTGASAETRLPQVAVSVGGAIPSSDWPTSPTNHLRADEKSMSPLRLLSYYLFKENPLVELEDWLKPQFRSIDAMSLRTFMTARGASPEAIRMMNVSIAARDLDDANALDFLRKQYYYTWEAKNGAYHVVRDGTDALTTAMAGSLKRKVLLGKNVARIDAQPASVSVVCKDGSAFRARICISTIPPTVFKDIPIIGAMPAAQRAAINTQRLVGLTQVFLKVKSRFWEKDGLPATMWTDGPAEIFIHAPSLTDENGVFYAYINGTASAALDTMPDSAVAELVLRELVQRRPAAAGQVEVARIHRWGSYPFSKGHIAYFAPGDIARYADIAGKPVGALHFAGEHLCRVHAGIEGACETAENAVIAILDRLEKS